MVGKKTGLVKNDPPVGLAGRTKTPFPFPAAWQETASLRSITCAGSMGVISACLSFFQKKTAPLELDGAKIIAEFGLRLWIEAPLVFKKTMEKTNSG